MNKRVWILGASDPEMAAIESLLRACGEVVEYAMTGGRRVTAGDAHRCDSPRSDLIWLNGEGRIIAVECDWVHLDGETGDVGHIDHHRPGDPGYGRGPAEFFAASSIGQVWAELVWLGLVSGAPPTEIVLVAAADHCLAHAYAGRCPGVDPDAVLRHRVKQQVAFRACPVCHGTGGATGCGGDSGYEGPCHSGPTMTEESVLADIEAARSALLAAPELILCSTRCEWHESGHSESDDCLNSRGTSYSDEPCRDIVVRDMRNIHVPGLPDAGTRYGIAYIADGLPGPDGRCKTVCSGSAEVVSSFIRWSESEGLVDAYGDPQRGFGGAYSTQ